MTTETPQFDPADPPKRPVSLADGDALDALVDAYDRVLVQFHTDGCSICQSMEPVLGALPQKTDTVVGTVNPRDDPPLIETYDVRSVPTLVLFVDGDPVDRLADGFVSTEDLVDFVERH